MDQTTTAKMPASTGDQQTLKDITERFRAFLATRKLRMTREREELLAAMFEAPRHFEAEDLIRTLKSRDGRVSRATVYRTLSLLEECGILRKSLFGRNRHFFESVVGRVHHDHLICIRTGKIIEFEDERIETLQKEIADRYGFRMVDHVHEVFGISPEAQTTGEDAEEDA